MSMQTMKLGLGLGLGLGMTAVSIGCDAEDDASFRMSPMGDCEFCEVDEGDALDPVGPSAPGPGGPGLPSGGSLGAYDTLHFKSVNNNLMSFVDFWPLHPDVRRGIYLATDCPPDAKYLVVLSNGQQGMGERRNGNESRTIGVEDSWRKDHCGSSTTFADCDLSLHANGLLRRVMEGNFFPPAETCGVFIADNASRTLTNADYREELVDAFASYIDGLVDVSKLEFMFVGAASRGAGMTFPLVLELMDRNGGDTAVPGSGWRSVPKVLAYNDPVWVADDPHLDTFRTPKVENPMIAANFPYASKDAWNTLDFAQELGDQLVHDRIRILSVVGGDPVVPSPGNGIRATGTERFETAQDMRGWDNPIEVFGQQCVETSAPYYTQLNARYPLTHSGINGTLGTTVTSTFGSLSAVLQGIKNVHFTVNPGQIYDTAALDMLAAALEDFGVRPSGYAFVDGGGAPIVPSAVPSIRTGGSLDDPSPTLAGDTVVVNEFCAPPTCSEVCDSQLDVCVQRFCTPQMPEPYMCDVVCPQRHSACIAGC